MTKYGIDVSRWQGVIQWDMVKGKIDFAILQAGYGRLATQKDEQFERNYAECKRLGIPIGAYWFGYASTEKEAKLEALACIEVLKDKKLDYPLYYDVEDQKMLKSGNVDGLITTFCKTLESAGIFAGFYMSRIPLNTYVSPTVRERFALWVAEYGAKCNYSGKYGMWQKSSNGKINGISGNVDLNECYEKYPDIINPKPKKVQKQVTLIIDDHKYSGLLTED